jgi:actin beta/gamma 1
MAAAVAAAQSVAIILDHGSWSSKAGYAGDEEPRVIFPTVVGHRAPAPVTVSAPPLVAAAGSRPIPTTCIGHEALALREELALTSPIERGIVTNWEAMEQLWRHLFDTELRVNPQDHPVVLTEAPLNPQPHRETMTQLMFETFQTPALYVATAALFSLYASGRVSGIVVDIGDTVTYTVPVYEGCVMPHAVHTLELGGRTMTDYLANILAERGYSFTTAAERDIVRGIKEQLCYIPNNFEQEMKTAPLNKYAPLEKSYQLPDGQVITIGPERLRVPEILFQPAFVGLAAEGLHTDVYQAIMKLDVSMRIPMYYSIVLTGGTAKLPGLACRLQKEVYQLAPPTVGVKAFPVQCYDSPSWSGGSVFASLTKSQQLFISKEEYAEFGAKIVQLKCF